MNTNQNHSKPLKITLACGDESNNIGDEAILASTINILKTKYPLSEITVFANDPGTISARYKVKTLPKGETIRSLIGGFLKTVKEIKNSNLFIWGGGQLVQDTSSQLYIPNHIWRFTLALILKKKVIAFAIGASPLKTGFSRYLIKKHLEKAQKISVRDHESKETLINIGINPDKVQVLYDPALSLKQFDKEKGKKLMQELGINPEEIKTESFIGY